MGFAVLQLRSKGYFQAKRLYKYSTSGPGLINPKLNQFRKNDENGIFHYGKNIKLLNYSNRRCPALTIIYKRSQRSVTQSHSHTVTQSHSHTVTQLVESIAARVQNSLTKSRPADNFLCPSDQSWALEVVFLNFFTNKKMFFCIFYQINNLFLHQSYLKSPLPVKLTL